MSTRPAGKTRVLIADDSAAIRAIVRSLLERSAEFEVVGAAMNGAIAVELCEKLAPDAVILDVEMPVMDGLAALRAIEARKPKTVVIMFSTLTDRGARITLDALSLGASDYVCKPVGKNLSASMAQVQTALVARLTSLCRPARGVVVPLAARSALAPARPRPPAARIDVVVMGVSTGGPRALDLVLPALPPGFPAPVLVVQHMPPTFTRLLAQRLDGTCKLSVVEAAEGMPLAPGKVYIAPGDRHMVIKIVAGRPSIGISESPPENDVRPAADPLFRSAAAVYGRSTLAVVMTGMGADGALGARHVREVGGQVWAQDEASSVVWGMPGAVVRAGLADRVLPLSAIAGEIAAVTERHAATQKGRLVP